MWVLILPILCQIRQSSITIEIQDVVLDLGVQLGQFGFQLPMPLCREHYERLADGMSPHEADAVCCWRVGAIKS